MDRHSGSVKLVHLRIYITEKKNCGFVTSILQKRWYILPIHANISYCNVPNLVELYDFSLLVLAKLNCIQTTCPISKTYGPTMRPYSLAFFSLLLCSMKIESISMLQLPLTTIRETFKFMNHRFRSTSRNLSIF